MVKHQYKLSICMMVKNEEDNIRRCLDRLKPLADCGLAELIIVDTGSTDKTVEIAKEYTNNIYYHEWNNNFSDMRNISISYAKGEWIFIIDADERLDDTDKIKILLEKDVAAKFNTVVIEVKNLYNKADEDRYNIIPSPRMFRNDGEFKYTGSVHNQPLYKQPTLSVDVSLTHFGYISSDKELMERKYIRTSSLLRSELQKDPENLYYLYQLAVSLEMHSEAKEAMLYYEKACDLLTNKELKTKKFYSYIYAAYGKNCFLNGKYADAINISKETISLREDYIDAYFILGFSYRRIGDSKSAFEILSKYIDLAESYSKMDISKDVAIIMYNIDKASRSNARYEISHYYLDSREYDKAYENAILITNKAQQIYFVVNSLLKSNNLKELKSYYLSLEQDNDRRSFLSTLESELKKLDEDTKIRVYTIFQDDSDLYGIYSLIRLSSGEEKNLLIKKFLELADLDKDMPFYSEVLVCLKNDIRMIVSILKKLETLNIRKAVNLLIEHDKAFIQIFEDFCINNNIRSSDTHGNRVLAAIMTVLLMKNIENNGAIGSKYSELFKIYLNYGINFVSTLYQMEKVRIIYKGVNNNEDRFFMLMHISSEALRNGDIKIALKYITEALCTYEVMVKYIDVFKNEVLNLECGAN